MVDRNRRVSTRIARGWTPHGIARIWHGTNKREWAGTRFLPVGPLRQAGKVPIKDALRFVARRLGVPKIKAGELHWKDGVWWLVTTW